MFDLFPQKKGKMPEQDYRNKAILFFWVFASKIKNDFIMNTLTLKKNVIFWNSEKTNENLILNLLSLSFLLLVFSAPLQSLDFYLLLMNIVGATSNQQQEQSDSKK